MSTCEDVWKLPKFEISKSDKLKPIFLPLIDLWNHQLQSCKFNWFFHRLTIRVKICDVLTDIVLWRVSPYNVHATAGNFISCWTLCVFCWSSTIQVLQLSPRSCPYHHIYRAWFDWACWLGSYLDHRCPELDICHGCMLGICPLNCRTGTLQAPLIRSVHYQCCRPLVFKQHR